MAGLMEAEARDLLDWYDSRARDLPWRRSRDPYRIWISEIMLQQTRVDVVIPYFQRFVERFPTVAALAQAPVEDVLAAWSGLGYYRRARQLHGAAQAVVENGGALPGTAAELQTLPGVGPYTAAAVASIAFGEKVPVLDGNVERVLSRRLGLTEDPKRKAGRERLLEAGARLLDPGRPGDSNQALMELGATLCSPRSPRCGQCPLSKGCQGRLEGRPTAYPTPKVKRTPKRVLWLAAVVQDQGRFLLFRRPEESEVLAGTWELPWIEVSGRSVSETLAEESLRARYGGDWSLVEPAGRVKHSITFRAITLEIFRAELSGGEAVAEGREAGFFLPEELSGLPLSSLVPKVLSTLEAERQRRLGFS